MGRDNPGANHQSGAPDRMSYLGIQSVGLYVCADL